MRKVKPLKLVKKYRSTIFHECRKIMIPGYEIEDLIQEATFQLYQSFEIFDPTLSAEKTWVINIVRRKLYQLWAREFNSNRMQKIGGKFVLPLSLDHLIEVEEDSEVPFSEMVPSTNNLGCCSYYDSPHEVLSYVELYKAIHSKLSPLSQIIFELKVNPPYSLFKMLLEKNREIKKLRKKGYYVRQSGGITRELLSQYTTLSLREISRCMDQIKDTAKLVLQN